MPDRRPRWRGIHDPEMVKSGVRVSLALDRARYRPGQRLRATVTVASVNVGHYFPTYVTPQVVVRAVLLGADRQPIASTEQEGIIGRQVPLDLSRVLDRPLEIEHQTDKMPHVRMLAIALHIDDELIPQVAFLHRGAPVLELRWCSSSVAQRQRSRLLNLSMALKFSNFACFARRSFGICGYAGVLGIAFRCF